MPDFNILILLIVLAAVFSYVNYRFLHLPPMIGLMLMGLATALAVLLLPSWMQVQARGLIHRLDFSEFVLQGVLGLILFSGSLHVDLIDLRRHQWPILTFATVGVLVSTAVVGGLTYGLSAAVGVGVPLSLCMVFGALISPTDPVSVLGILRESRMPQDMRTQIIGEAMLNDGVAVVVFLVMRGWALHENAHWLHTAGLLLQETLGGLALGVVLGLIAYYMLRSVDNYEVEILVTLALVLGGYWLAQAMDVSGLLAMVAAGLLIGNQGRQFAMSPRTIARLDEFWELIDTFLNAVLYLLIGLEVLDLEPTRLALLLAGLAVPVVLLARLVSLLPGLRMLDRSGQRLRVAGIMTWSGLRGGICIALVLSLPNTAALAHVRPILLLMTYSVTVFSLLAQALTLQRLVNRLLPAEGPGPAENSKS